MTREEEKKYDTVVEHGAATEAELDLVKSIVKLSIISYALATIHLSSGAEEEGPYIAD